MSLSIDWPTKVITVPKAYMSVIQTNPYYIYKLEINQFHLDLRTEEVTDQGIINLATHNHSTIVTLGGTTFARLVEVINGYTITFEDGQHAVSVEGGNTNIADVLNLNQVSVRTANTAGLIQVTSGSGVTEQDKTDIIDGVWNEILDDHLGVGSTGEKLNEGSIDIQAIVDAVWDELLSEHQIVGSAGESLYIAGRMAPEGGWMSSITASEVKLVRDKLGDAGNLIAETIVDEESIASSIDTLFTMYQMIFEVTGVWLKTDTEHVGTNYYTGANGEFNAHTGMITLHTSLPSANKEVIITYTYFKGLHGDVISQFLTEAKMYVKKYTRKTYDWTLAFDDPADEETQIALWAAAALASKRCLEALAAGDILQLGFNFRLGDLEIENMVRGGGFQVQAHIDMLNEDIEKKLAMLGRGMYFSTSSTKSLGRDFHGYSRRGTSRRRSDVQ